MAAFPWGALLSAGGSLLSGFMQDDAAKDAAARQQRAITDANKRNLKFAREQAAYADEYNKNKIQWLVDDARRSGLHPLAALGSSASGSFATPMAGSVEPEYGGSGPTGSAVGNALAQFGKDIQEIQMENARLQNEKLRTEIEAERLRMLGEARSRSLINRAGDASMMGIVPADSGNLDWVNERYGDEVAEYLFGVRNVQNDFRSTAKSKGGIAALNSYFGGWANLPQLILSPASFWREKFR